MRERERRLSYEAAQALWRRAAELQEEALRQVAEGDAAEGASPNANESINDRDTIDLSAAREAAREAGINETFVDEAARQLEVVRYLDQPRGSRNGPNEQVPALLDPEALVSVSRSIPAKLEAAADALLSVAERPGYELQIVELLQQGPGRVAYIFEFPSQLSGGAESGSFRYTVSYLADVKRIVVYLSAADRSESGLERTGVTCQCTLYRSWWVNRLTTLGMRIIAGGGLTIGGYFGAAALGAASLPVLLLGAAGAGIGGTAGLSALYSRWYRRTPARVRKAFEEFLNDVRLGASRTSLRS